MVVAMAQTPGRREEINMTSSKAEFAAARLALVGLIATGLALATGCQFNEKEQVVPSKWAPFIQQAQQADCTDIRNRLFVIDKSLVFADRAGSCVDESHSEVLYRGTVDDVLCFDQDSIGGPHFGCPDPSYEPMFDTIMNHLDEADLGLGSAHSVQQLQF
jgi:hypothetical protein